DGARLFISDQAANALVTIDVARREVVATTALGSSPEAIYLSPDGKWLSAAIEEDDQVLLIDAVSGRIAQRIKMRGKNPEHAVFSPDGKWLYVSSEEADSVDIVDLARNEVVKSVKVGDRPRGIGFLPDSSRAYVAAENADTINVFDVAKGEVVARIKAGSRSNGVTVHPDGKRVYVSSGGEGSVQVFELPTVTVIGTTPLPGLGTSPKDVPANVQVFGSRDLARQRPLDLTEFLDRNANSVGSASSQGNAYQRDLSFRGFAASPLLGTPQGISVFQDGVRINESFGDVVNWDLLPPSAISSVQLIPGSNPVFGLNTLGGALAIYTKSGAQYPGGSLQLSGGSFGRRTVALEYGGKRDRIDYFFTGDLAGDDGWAEQNASRLKRLFGKVGYQDDASDLDLSVTLADNTLHGTQTLPQSWLDTPKQAYTFPDINENRVAFLAAKGSLFLDDATLLGGNLYYRRYRNANVSSNVNGDYGKTDPEKGVLQTNEATNARSSIDQKSWGFGLQLTLQRDLA